MARVTVTFGVPPWMNRHIVHDRIMLAVAGHLTLDQTGLVLDEINARDVPEHISTA